MTDKRAGTMVVPTGASSGIGRATALEFARHGAYLALAARRDEPRETLVEAYEWSGSREIAAPTNVTDWREVEALAQRALGAFGRIDVWFNNAGVTLLGRFDETPIADHRWVIETNLTGQVNGGIAAGTPPAA